jgi:hypothetical protein
VQAIPARSTNRLPDLSHFDVYLTDEEIREVLIQLATAAS